MLAQKCEPRSVGLQGTSLKPTHTGPAREEARGHMPEMKSNRVSSEQVALGAHSAFPFLGPLPPRPYHILIDELPQVPEAMFLSNVVGIVAVLVGHTVCLQGSRAGEQQGSEVLQSVLCSKMQQGGQLFIPLI